jgi:PAS domain S-box-containing protein
MLEPEVSSPPGTRVQHRYTTVVGTNREFIDVSDSFCKLLGYERHDLIGLKYDDVTAPRTNDIPTVFCLFARQGYMHGLWMLRSREGENILVRYESWIRSDHHIQSVMELVA